MLRAVLAVALASALVATATAGSDVVDHRQSDRLITAEVERFVTEVEVLHTCWAVTLIDGLWVVIVVPPGAQGVGDKDGNVHAVSSGWDRWSGAPAEGGDAADGPAVPAARPDRGAE